MPTWYSPDGHVILSNSNRGRYRTQVLSKQSIILTIYDLQAEDNGAFICLADPLQGTIYLTIDSK